MVKSNPRKSSKAIKGGKGIGSPNTLLGHFSMADKLNILSHVYEQTIKSLTKGDCAEYYNEQSHFVQMSLMRDEVLKLHYHGMRNINGQKFLRLSLNDNSPIIDTPLPPNSTQIVAEF